MAERSRTGTVGPGYRQVGGGTETSEGDGIKARFLFKIRCATEVLRDAGTVPVVREEWMMVEMKATREGGKKGRKELFQQNSRKGLTLVGGWLELEGN